MLLLLTLALPRPGIPRDGTVEGVPRLLETDLRGHRDLPGGNGRTTARRGRPDPMLELALAIETRHVMRGGGGGGRHGVLALRRRVVRGLLEGASDGRSLVEELLQDVVAGGGGWGEGGGGSLVVIHVWLGGSKR